MNALAGAILAALTLACTSQPVTQPPPEESPGDARYGVWVNGTVRALGAESLTLQDGGQRLTITLATDTAFFDAAGAAVTRARGAVVGRRACIGGSLTAGGSVQAAKVFLDRSCGPVPAP